MEKRKSLYIMLGIVFLVFSLYIFSGMILTSIGEFLVFDEKPVPSDAVVVLCSGVEYYPRLIEASELFRKGLAKKIVINGNRKTDILRSLEDKGFKRCCPWYENSLRILSLLGVPRDNVVCISAEDAYDTVTEAEILGKEIIQKGFNRIIITTSKSHTRRARHIWSKMYGKHFQLHTVTAKTDPYDPRGWWREGRQVRWVLAEYGAWLYYYWKKIRGS